MYLTYSSIISANTTFSSPYAALLISLSLLVTIFGCHYFLFSLCSLLISLSLLITIFGCHYFLFSLCSLLISLLITIYKSLFTLLFPKCRLFSLVISLYSLVFFSFSFPKIQSFFFFFFFFLSLCHNKSQISPLQFPNCRPFLSKSSSDFFYLFGFSLFFFLFPFPFCQPNIISPPYEN
jgi:hypothetical protein